MINKYIMSGVMGAALLFVTQMSYAEKWDKNGYSDATIETGYYDVSSFKVKGKLVSWTEKYIFTGPGAAFANTELVKYKKCKDVIDKKGNVTQYQLDYQIENNKFRGAAKRYYTKENELICTNKDTGDDFKTDWHTIVRRSPIEQAEYDMVTKYKIKLP